MTNPLTPAELAYVQALMTSETARASHHGWSTRQRLARRVAQTRQALLDQGISDDHLRHLEEVAAGTLLPDTTTSRRHR